MDAGESRNAPTSSVEPLLRMTARSSTFSSSRTLPGHGYACNRCIDSALMLSMRRPVRAANFVTRN